MNDADRVRENLEAIRENLKAIRLPDIGLGILVSALVWILGFVAGLFWGANLWR